MSKIAEFQKKHGLVPDGLVGKNTFSKMKEVWKIKSDEQLANFLGQMAEETSNFNVDKENLKYTASQLKKYFSKYFKSDAEILLYAGKAEKIANRVYANRNGNGNEASGEGWKYRGAGGIQLTGKRNYVSFSNYLGLTKTATIDEIATQYFWEAGLFYFKENNLWELANKVSVEHMTMLSKAINLGNRNSKKTPNHLDNRIEKTKYYYKLITKK